VENAFQNWTVNLSFYKFKALPIIFTWGVWVARNDSLFNGKTKSLFLCALQGLNILKHFKQEGNIKAHKVIILEIQTRRELDHILMGRHRGVRLWEVLRGFCISMLIIRSNSQVAWA